MARFINVEVLLTTVSVSGGKRIIFFNFFFSVVTNDLFQTVILEGSF